MEREKKEYLLKWNKELAAKEIELLAPQKKLEIMGHTVDRIKGSISSPKDMAIISVRQGLNEVSDRTVRANEEVILAIMNIIRKK